MEPQDKRFGIIGNPAFHSIFLKHRSRGVQHYIDAMTEEARKSGENVMLISKNNPLKTLAGNFMLENPTVKRDPDLPVSMSFNTKVVMESRPQMKFPHKEGKAVFLSSRDYGHYTSFIMAWYLKPKMDKQMNDAVWGKSPDFDPQKLHLCLRDEAGMEKNFDLDEAWGRMLMEKHRRAGTYAAKEGLRHVLETLPKGAVAREEKPVKHNPRPSRFGFLEGLPNHKRR